VRSPYCSMNRLVLAMYVNRWGNIFGSDKILVIESISRWTFSLNVSRSFHMLGSLVVSALPFRWLVFKCRRVASQLT
jgi:hypothetical protein